jgi:HlyD family secretion protein
MARNSRFAWSKWITALVVLGAAVGGVMYFKDDHSEAPQYQTATVTRGDLTQVVTASGQLNPVLNVQVGSQISGNIVKLFADFNSLVKSNQVVAQLDPALFQASVHQAEGDLANAKAGLERRPRAPKRWSRPISSRNPNTTKRLPPFTRRRRR